MTTKAMSITALVLGIVSVVCAWFGIGAILGLIVGIVGLVFSVKARKALQADMANGVPAGNLKGVSTAGLVLNIIGVVLSGILFVCALCVVCTAAGVAGAAGSVSGLESLSGLYFI